MSISSFLESECLILLHRALLAKDVSIFGLDGNGLYGRDYYAHRHTIVDMSFKIDPATVLDKPEGLLQLQLSGYDRSTYGLAITDENLRISLDAHFKDELITCDFWDWAPVEWQGADFVTLVINAQKLLVL